MRHAPPPVQVPAGHSVTLYAAGPEPSVGATATGLLIAHLGYGGDDPDELTPLFQEVSSRLDRMGDALPVTRFASQTATLAELFVPHRPVTTEVRGGIVWTVRKDGLTALLDDPRGRERLFSMFRARVSTPQWFVIDEQWTSGEAPLRRLQSCGVEVRQAASGTPCLAEVKRPDGASVTGLVGGAPEVRAPSAAREALHRAPRLRRLLLNAVSSGPSPAFYDELLALKSPLLFLAGADRAPSMMRWPGRSEPLLPVFGDLTSLRRAARETGRAEGSYGVGALGVRELFAFAKANGFGLGMGVFLDSGEVRYLQIVTTP